VAEESAVVTEHLRSALSPDAAVLGPLRGLGEQAGPGGVPARLRPARDRPGPGAGGRGLRRRATSADRAGCPTVGNLTFVREDERSQRRAALVEAGVLAVVTSWEELADLVAPGLSRRTAA
jgi:hypothetical protein